MTIVNLISEYRHRNIEGIDKQDLFEALDGTSSTFKSTSDKKITYIPTKQEIHLECVSKYFNPVESYYKIKDTDGCKFIQTALGINEFRISNCNQCFKQCILHNKSIKRNKVAFDNKIFK